MKNKLTSLLLILIILTTGGPSSAGFSLTDFQQLENQLGTNLESFLSNSSIEHQLNQGDYEVELVINATSLLTELDFPQNIKVGVYFKEGTEETLVSVINQTIRRPRSARQVKFIAKLPSLEKSGTLVFKVYDASGNLHETHEQAITIVNGNSQDLVELANYNCALNDGECLMQYILNNVSFSVVDDRKFQTSVYRNDQGKYYVSIPSRKGGKSVKIITRRSNRNNNSNTAEDLNGTYPYYETASANGNTLIAQTTWDQTKEAVELSFVNSEFKFYFKEDGTLISDTVETNKLVLKQGDTLNAKQASIEFVNDKLYFTINGDTTELGAMGPPGPQGPQGPQGQDGAGAGSLGINDLTDAITNSTSVFLFDGSGAVDNGDNYNTALGENTLNLNVDGKWNTAIGSEAMRNAAGANSNTAIGRAALYTNTTGGNNVAVGAGAMRENTSGFLNTAVGNSALRESINGIHNVAVGYDALRNSLGNGNIALGFAAGEDITTGRRNILVGYSVNGVSAIDHDQLNIGNTIYGDLANGEIALGKPTNNPGATLLVNGSLQFVDGNQANGFVLTSNGGGMATWQSIGTALNGALSSGIAGAIQFSDGSNGFSSDETNLFWDDGSDRLGVNVAAPQTNLHVNGNAIIGNFGLNTTMLGNLAGTGQTGSNNTIIGQSAGQFNTGSNNLIAGSVQPGEYNSGDFNVILGNLAGEYNNGDYSTIIGYYTGQHNEANYVNAIGSNTAGSNTGTNGNFMGRTAARYNSGNGVIAIGYNTAWGNNGDEGIFLGRAAGYNNNGDQVTGIGFYANRYNTEDYVTGIGYYAGTNNVGYGATSIGTNAGRENNGNYLAALGWRTAYFNKAGGVSAFGRSAAEFNTGDNGTFLGRSAGYTNTGVSNTMVGYNAGAYNNGDYSTMLGRAAGIYNNGNYLVALGHYTARENSANNVVAIGNQAARYNSGAGAIGIGERALMNNNGNYNIAVGFNTANGLNNGSFNIFVGYDVEALDDNGSYELNIGDTIYGDLNNGEIALGSATNNPQATLDLTGSLRYIDGNQANGYVLTSNGGGFASWEPAATGASSSGAANLIQLSDGVGDFSSNGLIYWNPTTNGQLVINSPTGSTTALDVNGSAIIGQKSLGSTLIGENAGQNNTGDFSVVAIGSNAGTSNSGNSSVLIGNSAGNANTGLRSVAIGSLTGRNNTGSYLVAIGYDAGANSIGSQDVTAIGRAAARNNSGFSTVFLGENSGYSNTGNSVIAIGSAAARYNSGTNVRAVGTGAVEYNSGSDVHAYGAQAAEFNNGDDILALGQRTLRYNNGDYNIAMGYWAGEDHRNGSYNIMLGYQAEVADANGDNQISIANLVYGNSSTNEIVINKAVADPAATLEVNGSVMADEVLVFDESVSNTSGGAVTIDWNTGNNQEITLAHNPTFTFTDPPGVAQLVLFLTQDGTGSRTVTWPAAVEWEAATAPTLTTTAGQMDIIYCTYRSSKYYCHADLNYTP